MRKQIWTKEKCYEIAKKYITLKEFREKEIQCYTACIKYKFIKDFDWLKRGRKKNGFWTKEKCYEEAQKYNNIKDFEINSMSSCVIARRNGWLKEYTWLKRLLKPNGFWKNKDNVFEVAHKCHTKSEFKKRFPNAYEWSKKYGWLDEMDWLKPTITNIGYNDYCVYSYNDEENKVVYVGLTHDKKRRHKEHLTSINSKGKKIISTPNRYFGKLGIEIPNPIYLEENLTSEQAQIAEEKWVLYYKDNGYKILNKSKVGKNVSGLGGGILIWTKEKSFEESKKYTSRSEFKNKSNGAYRASIKNKWIDEMDWLIPRQKPSGYWKNKEHIVEVSKLCKKRSDFKNKYRNAYDWAKKYNMLDDLFKVVH